MTENNFDIKLSSAKFNVYNNDSGNSYTVNKYKDLWSCDCKAFHFCIEPKSCKHIEECKDSVCDIIVVEEEDDE